MPEQEINLEGAEERPIQTVQARLARLHGMSAVFEATRLREAVRQVAAGDVITQSSDYPSDDDRLRAQIVELRAFQALLISRFWADYQMFFQPPLSSLYNLMLPDSVSRLMEAGLSFTDAFLQAEMLAIGESHSSLKEAPIEDGSYSELQQRYEAHLRSSGDERIVSHYKDRLLHGFFNGLVVILGLTELIPSVYQRNFGDVPDLETHLSLLEADVLSPILRVWSSMKAEVVQHVERVASREGTLRTRTAFGSRMQFDPAFFELIRLPDGGFRLVPTDDFLSILEQDAPQPPSAVLRTRCPARTAHAEGHLSVLEEYVPLILGRLRHVLAATKESF